LKKAFGRKSEDVLRNAMLAFDAGYAYPIGDIIGLGFDLKEGAVKGADKITTDGNTAMTLGLLAGGSSLRSRIPDHSLVYNHGAVAQ
jgi:2-oxoglutarate ferredoxin oxidoreductase subunit alpha